MVESQPSKLLVASSILVSRSKSTEPWLHEQCSDAALYREAAQLCAGHAQQFGGESPLPNLMEVKG